MAQRHANALRQLRIPRGCQSYSDRVPRGRAPGTNSHRPVRHFERRQADGGHGWNKHAINPVNQVDLLRKSQLAKQRLHLAIDLLRRFLLPSRLSGQQNQSRQGHEQGHKKSANSV